MIRSVNFPEPSIRPAEESDAAAIAEIYAPYVLQTAISFETEPPTAATMAQRIVGSLETHPWLVALCGGKIAGYAYAGKHRERAAYRWSVQVTIYVSSATQRNGVGRALYSTVGGAAAAGFPVGLRGDRSAEPWQHPAS
jgi:L-amino acid N-acyltransferase YncA